MKFGRKARPAETGDRVDSCVAQLVNEVRPPTHGHDISDDTALREDLGMDSLAAVALAFRLEEELGIDYMTSLELAQDVVTVGDLKSAVRENLAARS